MSQDVVVPDIGDFKEVEVIEVLVKPGDAVSKEQSLVTLESDKATMEIPSPNAGVVKELKIKVGDKVSKGSPILVLDDKGNGEAPPEEKPQPQAAKAEAPEASRRRRHDGSGPRHRRLQGSRSHRGPGQARRLRDEGAIAHHAGVRQGDDGDPVACRGRGEGREGQGRRQDLEGLADPGPGFQGSASTGKSRSAKTPAVEAHRQPRHLRQPPRCRSSRATKPPPSRTPAPRCASSRASSASTSRACRAAGRRAASCRPTCRPSSRASFNRNLRSLRKAAAQLPFNLPAWPEVDFAKFGPIESKPLSRIQKLSGPYLHRNWISIPHVTQFDEADITDLEAFRKAQTVETEKKGFKLTMLAFMIKACVTALKQFPQFNSSLDKSGENLIIKKYFHIGVAVDTPGGLVVPVVRDADRKGVFDIAHELAEISKVARDGKLKPGDMQGGTFSISSLGGIGGTAFTPIINAPEVAILGVSRGAHAPGVERQGVHAAPDAAAFALLRPPRDRRRDRRALLRLPRLGAVRHPQAHPLDGRH